MNRPRQEVLKKLVKLGLLPSKDAVRFLFTDTRKAEQAFNNNSTTSPGSSQQNQASTPTASQNRFNSTISNLDNTIRQAVVKSPAAYFGALQVRDEFQFETSPALQVMSKTMGDFSGVIANSMRESEQFVLDLTNQLSNAAAIVAGVVFTRGLLVGGAGRAAAGAGLGAGLTRFLRFLPHPAARVASMVLPALPAVTRAIGEFFIFASLQVALKKVVDRLTGPYQRKIFQSTLAAGMIQPSVSAEFMRQTRGIPNYTRERFQLLQAQTVDYAATNEQLYNVLQVISKRTPNVENLNSFVSTIVNTANFFGVDESLISQTYSNLAAVSTEATNNPQKIQPVTRAFEEFYLSLSDSANPVLVNLSLVDSLASFTANYTFTRSMATSAGEVARIQDFISRTSIGNKVTTEVTRNLIRGVDNVFSQFGDFSNPQVASFLQSVGITRSEAIRGITADADTYQSLISGLANRFGIGENMSDEEFGQLMFFLTQQSGPEGGFGLGFSHEDAQAIAESVRSYGAGNRVNPSVRGGSFNIPGTEGGRNVVLPIDSDDEISISERAELDKLYKPLMLASSLSKGEFLMFDVNIERVSLAVDMTKRVNNTFIDRFTDILSTVSELGAYAVGLLSLDEPTKLEQTKNFFLNSPFGMYVNLTNNIFRDGSFSFAPRNNEVSIPDSDYSEAEIIEHATNAAQGAGVASELINNRTLGSQRKNKLAERDIAQQLYNTGRLPNQGLITGVYDEFYNFDVDKDGKVSRGEGYHHKGIDIDMGDNQPYIYSTMQGVVVNINGDADHPSGYGIYVIIKDEYDFYHYYSHLSSLSVNKGQQVDVGQVIGRQGNTGKSTGSHLHYEIRGPDNTVRDRIDPVVYFELLETVFQEPEWWEEDSFEFLHTVIDADQLEQVRQEGYTNKAVLHRLFNRIQTSR